MVERQRDISALLHDTQILAEARKAGRLNCELVDCDLGELSDISSTGMRVKVKSGPGLRVGDALNTTISGPGVTLTVGVRVVWMKKIGFFKSEVGLEFVEMNAEARLLFSRLVKSIVA